MSKPTYTDLKAFSDLEENADLRLTMMTTGDEKGESISNLKFSALGVKNLH